MKTKSTTGVTAVIAVTTALLTLAACGQEDKETTIDAAETSPPTATTPVTEMPRTAAPDGARVFIISPADGATVASPFKVEFGIEGMDVVRAGDNTPDSGHHHILIDTDLPMFNLPVPADGQHVHFGDGSTATELTLASGEHTLQLLLGDHLHIPHNPPVYSTRITVTVE